MRKIYLLPLLALFFIGCGPDADLVASGKNHQCNIQRVKAQLEEDPNNEALQKELEEFTSYYESVIQSADEGSRSALETAIKDAVESEGCQ